MDRLPTLEPTLDPQRTDQLRTFLTVEAAADAASGRAPAPARRGRRRLVVGVVAATVLGAGLFAAAAIAGGPTSGPTSVQTAHAVAIEQAAPGWTKITINDIDADPDAVLAELQAAGIDARREHLDVQRDAEGRVLIGRSSDGTTSGLGNPADDGGFTMVGVSETGQQGLAGLSVSAPGKKMGTIATGASSEEIEAAFTSYLADLGARSAGDGSIEIRNDADITVIVLTED